MRETKAFDSIYELSLVGRTFSVTWARNESETGNSVAGFCVGIDEDARHIYISINPEHDREACYGEISDKKRKELGIEKIAVEQIRVITPLRGDTSFVPKAHYLKI